MSDYLHPDDARGDWVDHECSQGGSNSKAEARWDAMIARARADAWDEAYWQGVDDERTAQVLQVDVGIGVPAQANRSNPYRIEGEA